MNRIHVRLVFLAAVMIQTLIWPLGAQATDPVDDNWSSVFSRPGIDGEVKCMATDSHGTVYVGGKFARAGGVPASNIARRDGEHWTALGSGVDGGVYALASDGTAGWRW